MNDGKPRRRAATAWMLCALSALAATSIIAISLAAYPTAVDGWLYATRYTARFSFLVFLPVFVARPWHQLWPGGVSRWAVSNRRALGLAFATAHFIHLFALTRFRVESAEMPELVTLIVGGSAYVLLAAMTVTSNDASVRALGARNWKRLHTTGLYAIWFVFFQSYAGRVASGMTLFLPLLLLSLGALSLRGAAAVRRRRRVTTSGAPALDV